MFYVFSIIEGVRKKLGSPGRAWRRVEASAVVGTTRSARQLKREAERKARVMLKDARILIEKGQLKR